MLLATVYLFIIFTQDQPENHLRVRLPLAKDISYMYYSHQIYRQVW